MIRAIIFDFDGLILDTEVPIFQSWQELYREYGFQLSFETWSGIIGTTGTDYDPLDELEKLLGQPVGRKAISAGCLQRETSLILEQPVLPGVLDYLEGTRRLGLRVGLASSSSCEWVTGHLSRLGLLNYFHEIRASEDVKRTKPDPALYLQVLHGLGVPAVQGVALEDSPNGILAAKRAGLFCVAVPNALTRRLPLDHADLRLESLADLPLESLLVEVEGRLHDNG